MEEMLFSELFDQCELPAGGERAIVRSVRVFAHELRMEVDAYDPSGSIHHYWISGSERSLEKYYGMQKVNLRLDYPQEKKIKNETNSENDKPQSKKTIFGKAVTGHAAPLEYINREEGKVTVHGQVIACIDEIRERYGQGSFVWFDITDHTGAIRIAKQLKNDQAKALHTTIKKIRSEGGWVTVSGKLEQRKDNQEWILSPDGISEFIKSSRKDTSVEKRVELHLHTQMSAKDATTDVGLVISTAAGWGHPAIAITDHGVCHSFPEAMKAADKMSKKGIPIKIIYGCEGYMPHEKGNYHIILLAKNLTGLKNLYQLVSLAHVEHFHGRPLMPRSLIEKYRTGLIIGSACEAGDLFKAIINKKPYEELLETAKFYDYLEIQPICNNHFLIREKIAADEDELREYNKTIVKLGEQLGLPVCATGDVHFLEPEHEVHRRVLLSVMNMNHEDPLPLYFKTTQEMLEEFSYLGEEKALEVVVTNPQKIAETCEEIKPVRSGEFFPHIEKSGEELRRLTMTKAEQLYGTKLPDILEERIKIELNSIIEKCYDIIYMIAQKLVQRSLQEGYLVGSRGSVGSSIVAFLSGITEVNALPPHYRCPNQECKHWEFPADIPATCGPDMPDKNCPVCGTLYEKDGFDIPFATFLGFQADKKPDIDLNFSGEYQSKAHQHTVEIFGESKVFRAGTITTLKEKNAIGYALKYAGENATAAERNWLSMGCVGVKTTTGQHPGGLIIVPAENDIYEFCPVQYPANKKDNMITTHFDYHAIEENLLKLDLLGHDDPTMIRMLEDLTGIKKVPLDDKATISIFTSSRALGFTEDKLLGPTGAVAVPEFGTRFVRGMLTTTMPTTFDELVRISGLSHGTDVWLGNAETLVSKKIATLKEVICARDDIMLYLISKGMDKKLSFTIMESVRKGKGLTSEWEAAMKTANVPDWYIDSCKKIKYMFPKAHAVAYVQMAFRIAWFKVHHPLAFYAAYFSIRAVQFDVSHCARGIDKVKARIAEIEKNKESSDADKNQVSTLEVCYEFYLRGFSFDNIDILKSHASKFLIDGNKLIPPFSAIPGLGGVAAESIVSERSKEKFLSAEDVLSRCKINKNHLEILKNMGVFGDLPESSQTSIFDLLA